MSIPVSYNLRNLVVRKTTTLMTALGIALTVAVLLAMLALVNGLKTTLSTPAIRCTSWSCAKARTPSWSAASRATAFQDLKFKPGIAAGATATTGLARDGYGDQPCRRRQPDGVNVTLRGLLPPASRCGRDVKIQRRRWFRPGTARDRCRKVRRQAFSGRADR